MTSNCRTPVAATENLHFQQRFQTAYRYSNCGGSPRPPMELWIFISLVMYVQDLIETSDCFEIRIFRVMDWCHMVALDGLHVVLLFVIRVGFCVALCCYCWTIYSNKAHCSVQYRLAGVKTNGECFYSLADRSLFLLCSHHCCTG